MNVGIASGIVESLVAHAAAAAPDEACGLLLGTPGQILRAEPAANVAANPARAFEIDPAALLHHHRAARGDGMTVIGHYHSHPNGRAEPSKRDAARAVANGQFWLIVADGGVTAWAVAPGADALHGQFRAVTLDVK